MSDVSCLITSWKRQATLAQQIEAVKNQSVKPVETVVWQNHVDDRPIDEVALAGVTHVRSNKNWGVWPRFLFAMEFSTEYVCIFDDDTIPGSKWLENCLTTIQSHNGLLGSIGVWFPKGTRLPHHRAGWATHNEQVRQVDIVGHSWFFRRKWLRHYALEPRMGGRTWGEDYHFSVAIQKHLGLGTYVPPQPKDKPEMSGSLRGYELGSGPDSLWEGNIKFQADKITESHNLYLKAGWLPMSRRKK